VAACDHPRLLPALVALSSHPRINFGGRERAHAVVQAASAAVLFSDMRQLRPELLSFYQSALSLLLTTESGAETDSIIGLAVVNMQETERRQFTAYSEFVLSSLLQALDGHGEVAAGDPESFVHALEGADPRLLRRVACVLVQAIIGSSEGRRGLATRLLEHTSAFDSSILEILSGEAQLQSFTGNPQQRLAVLAALSGPPTIFLRAHEPVAPLVHHKTVQTALANAAARPAARATQSEVVAKTMYVVYKDILRRLFNGSIVTIAQDDLDLLPDTMLADITLVSDVLGERSEILSNCLSTRARSVPGSDSPLDLSKFTDVQPVTGAKLLLESLHPLLFYALGTRREIYSSALGRLVVSDAFLKLSFPTEAAYEDYLRICVIAFCSEASLGGPSESSERLSALHSFLAALGSSKYTLSTGAVIALFLPLLHASFSLSSDERETVLSVVWKDLVAKCSDTKHLYIIPAVFKASQLALAALRSGSDSAKLDSGILLWHLSMLHLSMRTESEDFQTQAKEDFWDLLEPIFSGRDKITHCLVAELLRVSAGEDLHNYLPACRMAGALGLFSPDKSVVGEQAILTISFACLATIFETRAAVTPGILEGGLFPLFRSSGPVSRLFSLSDDDRAVLETPAGQLSEYQRGKVEQPVRPRNPTLKEEQDYKSALRNYEGELSLRLAQESSVRASLLTDICSFRSSFQAAGAVMLLCRGPAFVIPHSFGWDRITTECDVSRFSQESISLIISLCGVSPLLASAHPFLNAILEATNLFLSMEYSTGRYLPLAAISPRLLLILTSVVCGCVSGSPCLPNVSPSMEDRREHASKLESAFHRIAREAFSARMLGPGADWCSVSGIALSIPRVSPLAAPCEGRETAAPLSAQDSVGAFTLLKEFLRTRPPAIGASSVALLFQVLCRAFASDSRDLVPQRARQMCLDIIGMVVDRSATCQATAASLRCHLNFGRAFQLLGEATSLNLHGERIRSIALGLARLVPVSASSLGSLIGMLSDAENPALRRLAADALTALPVTGDPVPLDEASYCALFFSEDEFEGVHKFFVSCGRELVVRERGAPLSLRMIDFVVQRCLACLQGCQADSELGNADAELIKALQAEFLDEKAHATDFSLPSHPAEESGSGTTRHHFGQINLTATSSNLSPTIQSPSEFFQALKLCEFHASRLPAVLVTLCTECPDKEVFLAVLQRLLRLYQLSFCPLEEVRFSSRTLHGLFRSAVVKAFTGLCEFLVNRDASVLSPLAPSGDNSSLAFPLRAGLISPPYSTSYPMACDVAPEKQREETLERRRKREDPLVIGDTFNEHLKAVPYTGEPKAFIASLRHSGDLYNELIDHGRFAPQLESILGMDGQDIQFTYTILLVEVLLQHGLTEFDPSLNEAAVSCLLRIISVYGRYYVKRLQYLRDINRTDLSGTVSIEPVSVYITRRISARLRSVLKYGALCSNTLDDPRQIAEAKLLEIAGLVRCLGELVYYFPEVEEREEVEQVKEAWASDSNAASGAAGKSDREDAPALKDASSCRASHEAGGITDPRALRSLISSVIDDVLRVRDTSAKAILVAALVEFFPKMLEGAHHAHAYGVSGQARAALERYGQTLLRNHKIYPGSAYALAGVCRAVGLGALLQFGVLETYILPLIAKGLSFEASGYSSDENSILDEPMVDSAVRAFESLYIAYGALLEPYATTILRYILPMPASKTRHLLSLMLTHMTKFGASFLLPTLLSAMSYDSSWQEKKGACEVIKAIATSENRTVLSALLPSLMPVLQRLLHDTHREVARSVSAAMDSVVLSVRNPEVRKISRVLVRAFENVGLLRQSLVTLAEVTFSSRLDASSLTILVPLCERALLVPSTEIYIAGADRMVGTHTKVIACMCLSVIFRLTRPQDLRLYLPRLKGVLRGALGDTLPEIRSSAAQAFNTLVHILPGEAAALRDELWAEMYKSRLSVNESHGLAEAICSVSSGADRILESLGKVFGAGPNATDAGANQGGGNRLAFVLLLLYLPQKLEDREEFVRDHLSSCLDLTLQLAADESQTIRSEITGRVARQLCTTFLDTPASTQLVLQALERHILSESNEICQLCLTLVGDIVCELGSQLTAEEQEQGKERKEISIKVFIPETAIARAISAMTYPMYVRLMISTYLLRFHPEPDIHHLAVNTWKAVVYKPVPLMEEFLGQLGPYLTDCYSRALEQPAGRGGESPTQNVEEPPPAHESRAARLAREFAAGRAVREAQNRQEIWTSIPEGAIAELVKYTKERCVQALSAYALGVLAREARVEDGPAGAEPYGDHPGSPVDADAPASTEAPPHVAKDHRAGCLHILAALVELSPGAPELMGREVTDAAATNLSSPSLDVATAAARLFGNLNRHGIIGEAALSPLVDRVFMNPRAVGSLAGIVQQQAGLLTSIIELILQREITEATHEVIEGLFSRVTSPSALILRVLQLCSSQLRKAIGLPGASNGIEATGPVWVGLGQPEVDSLKPLLGVSRSCFQALRRGLETSEYRFQLRRFTTDLYESDPTVSLLFFAEVCRGDPEIIDDSDFALAGSRAVVEAFGRSASAAIVGHVGEALAFAMADRIKAGVVPLTAFLGARDALDRLVRTRRVKLLMESAQAVKPLLDVVAPMISTKYPLNLAVDPLVRRLSLEFCTLLVLGSAGATLPDSTAKVIGAANAGPAAEFVVPRVTDDPAHPEYTVGYGDTEFACVGQAQKSFVVSLLGKIVLAFNEPVPDAYRLSLCWAIYVCLTCGPDSARMLAMPLQTILERKGLLCPDAQVRNVLRGCMVRLAEVSPKRENIATNLLEMLLRKEFRPEQSVSTATTLLTTLAAVLPIAARGADPEVLLRLTDAVTRRYLLGVTRALLIPAARCVAVALSCLPQEQAVRETVVLAFGPDDQLLLRQGQHYLIAELLAIPAALPVILAAATIKGGLMSWLFDRLKVVQLAEIGGFCRLACRLCEAADSSSLPQVRSLLAMGHQCLSRVVYLFTDEAVQRAAQDSAGITDVVTGKLEALDAIQRACERVSAEVGRMIARVCTPVLRAGLADKRPAIFVRTEETLISAYRLRLGTSFAYGVIDSISLTSPALGNDLKTHVGMLMKRIQSGRI